MYLARVYVSLKPTVNDPQGIAVLDALRGLGFASATGVRVGKFMEIRLDEPDITSAQVAANEMCANLLANPVIEQYSVELVEETA